MMRSADILFIYGDSTWIGVSVSEIEGLLRYMFLQFTSFSTAHSSDEHSVDPIRELVKIQRSQLRVSRDLLLLQRQENKDLKERLDEMTRLMETMRNDLSLLKVKQLPTGT